LEAEVLHNEEAHHFRPTDLFGAKVFSVEQMFSVEQKELVYVTAEM
jgi:hypothetical protein